MITAQVKGLYTPHMDKIEEHPPSDPEIFCIGLRVLVGPLGAEGEESFDINVCSSKWLEQYIEREGFLFGRHYLFVSRYDIALIANLVTRFVERCTGESWQDVASKISKIGQWEFEDFAGGRGSKA